MLKVGPIIKANLKPIKSFIPVAVKIEQDIDSDCGEIKADATHIYKIVMNILATAFHPMEERSAGKV